MSQYVGLANTQKKEQSPTRTRMMSWFCNISLVLRSVPYTFSPVSPIDSTPERAISFDFTTTFSPFGIEKKRLRPRRLCESIPAAETYPPIGDYDLDLAATCGISNAPEDNKPRVPNAIKEGWPHTRELPRQRWNIAHTSRPPLASGRI